MPDQRILEKMNSIIFTNLKNLPYKLYIETNMTRRNKYCHRCKIDFEVLFRVQYEEKREWVFICTSCLNEVKPENPHYRYGGTWKK